MDDFLNNKIILSDMEEIYARGYEWDSLNGKTVLITGAYGMLASYMAYYLIYLREIKGISLNIVAQGKNENKARLRFGKYFDRDYFIFLRDDILAAGYSKQIIADYIIHAAGIANPRMYGTNPVEVIEPSVIGTYKLLCNCDRERLLGFLFFSTCDVYGSVGNVELITEETVGGVDPLDPHSCYNESRRMAETMLAAYNREYGIRTLIARIGHTYGPTMDIKNDPRTFASFMNNAISGTDIILHSDGLAQRPFCYLSDAVAGYFLILFNGEGGEAYNVTNTDQMMKIRSVAEIIASLPKDKVNVVFRERHNDDSYQTDTVNIANKPVEEKLVRLGWNHMVDVREGFSRVYNFFVTNY